jgi:hypothetical protein
VFVCSGPLPAWLPAISFKISSQRHSFPQPLYNQHLRQSLGAADSKGLTDPAMSLQVLYFQHLRAPHAIAVNKAPITPLECALTRVSPANPLESALTKKVGGGVSHGYLALRSHNASRRRRNQSYRAPAAPISFGARINLGSTAAPAFVSFRGRILVRTCKGKSLEAFRRIV